jgi:UDP-glucuronate 4-epimerase
MKILVTGGAGFIGSALAKRLLASGHTVVVLDNFNEYYDIQLKRARQEALLSGIEVVEGDITDKVCLQELFSTHDFDLVCHLAAQAGVRHSVEHPEVYMQSNVQGTQILFEVMKEFEVMRMVFASTSSVYGTNTDAPYSEDVAADRPVSVYAASKRAGELLAHAYYALYGIETICLRFFTVYGPWSRPDMAMFKFAKLMSEGSPIDVYNNGDLRRDFTHIDDIVEGFILAVEKPLGYEVINLGGGTSIELNTYISLLETALNQTVQKNMLPMQPGDMYETCADTTKAKALLGFEAKMSVEQGVGTFAQWYQAYYLQQETK